MNINYDHPNQPDDSKSEFQDGFFDWLDTAGDYRDYVGCHVGVADGYDHAGGEGHDGQGKTAFSKVVGADVGIAGPEERWKNYAVQEPMHMFINAGLDEVKQLCTPDCEEDNSCVPHEHDLGQIQSTGAVTPLATLYEDSHAQHGECETPYTWAGTYDYTITGCTVDAVRYTANDET